MNEKVIKKSPRKQSFIGSTIDFIKNKIRENKKLSPEEKKILNELYKKQTTEYKLKKIIQKIERTKSREKQRKVRDKPTSSKITTGYNLAKKGGKIKKKK